MGMTWGELAKILGFQSYGRAWMDFRQWAGYSWDSDNINPDGPVSTDKALQLLLQRLGELNVLKEMEKR